MRLTASAVFALVLTSGAAPAAAQNLVSNPGFHDNLDGWGTFGFTSHDPADDADGSPGSGSARLVADYPDETPFSAALVQCVDGIIEGATYEFGGQILLSDRPDGGSAQIELHWQAGPCAAATTMLGLSSTTDATALGAWQSVSGMAVAPSDADSVVISGHIVFVPGEYEINFDNLYLQLISAPVPTMDAVWSFALLLLLTLAVAVRLRPSRQAVA